MGETTTAVFTAPPERVQITDAEGKVLQERVDPRPSFPDYDPAVRWDELHMAYFAGYANWNYFTEPFLFTYPGVEAHEIEPWEEDGQKWRRLAVTFPSHLPTHNAQQTFYYDDNLLQRRMDSCCAAGSSALSA